ncbi:hypothetical protein AAFC00_003503 [Neodothiora populina]
MSESDTHTISLENVLESGQDERPRWKGKAPMPMGTASESSNNPAVTPSPVQDTGKPGTSDQPRYTATVEDGTSQASSTTDISTALNNATEQHSSVQHGFLRRDEFQNPARTLRPFSHIVPDTVPGSARNARSRASIHSLPPMTSYRAEECRRLSNSPIMTLDRDFLASSTLQRVYRKPRQRIRYMCHTCNVPLLQSQNCDKCGHHRCPQCIRRPSIKVRNEPDPRYVEAVERRLSSMSRGMTSAGSRARAQVAMAMSH